MNKMLWMATLILLTCCFGACSESGNNTCEIDVNAIERQRRSLCQNKSCGDVVFVDECNNTHTKSCGSCQGGEICMPEGMCAECTGDAQCPSGYQCDDYACVQRADYCENNADCADKGGGLCEENVCVASIESCGTGAACDAENGEMCVNESCKEILLFNNCTATGNTTLASSVAQAIATFDGPENIYEYTATEDDIVMLYVTPSDLSFDPAVYVLSSVSPTPELFSSLDDTEVVSADEEVKGEPELLLFTVTAGETYYFVVTSDASKQNGQYKQGRYTICMESTACGACEE